MGPVGAVKSNVTWNDRDRVTHREKGDRNRGECQRASLPTLSNEKPVCVASRGVRYCCDGDAGRPKGWDGYTGGVHCKGSTELRGEKALVQLFNLLTGYQRAAC